MLKRAYGGVLFIDEAYYLHRPENERDYGQEAIEILLQVMEAERDRLVVILAGYRDRMEAFFRSNPGMGSRVAHHIDFPDYGVDELMAIARLMLEQRGYELDAGGARPRSTRYVERRIAQPRFANARSIRNAIDRARLRQAGRLFERSGAAHARRPRDDRGRGHPAQLRLRRRAVTRDAPSDHPRRRRRLGRRQDDDHARAGAAARRGAASRTSPPTTTTATTASSAPSAASRRCTPECNYVDIMEQHFGEIRAGALDPQAGLPAPGRDLRRARCTSTPRHFTVVEGLLGYHTEALRDVFDVRVFLAPPEELRRQWKVDRDCSRRGYTTDQVLEELDRREHDSEAFIRPQQRFADIVVSFMPGERGDQGHLDARAHAPRRASSIPTSTPHIDGERAG